MNVKSHNSIRAMPGTTHHCQGVLMKWQMMFKISNPHSYKLKSLLSKSINPVYRIMKSYCWHTLRFWPIISYRKCFLFDSLWQTPKMYLFLTKVNSYFKESNVLLWQTPNMYLFLTKVNSYFKESNVLLWQTPKMYLFLTKVNSYFKESNVLVWQTPKMYLFLTKVNSYFKESNVLLWQTPKMYLFLTKVNSYFKEINVLFCDFRPSPRSR